MATVRQLTGAGGGATPQASTAVTQTSGTRSAKYQSGESLANDLSKIMGETAKTAQTFYTASKQAAQRVASDKSVELAEFISNVRGTINYDDPKSLANAQKEIALKQAELSNVEFDLDVAQESFDDTYTKPAAKQVGALNAQLKKQELVKLDDENLEDINLKTELRYTNNVYLSEQEIKANVKSATAYKRFEKEDVEYMIADQNTTAFDTKITEGAKTVLEGVGYNTEDGWNIKVAKRLFDKEFGAWATMKDDGEIVWKEDFENKAKEEILRSWSAFDRRMRKDGDDPYNELFYLTKTSGDRVQSNASDNYIPSANIKKNIDTAELGFIEADNFFPLNDVQKKDRKVTLGKLRNTYDETTEIERDILSGNVNVVRSYLEDGKEVRMYDHINQKERIVKLPASKYKKAVKFVLDEMSMKASGIQIKSDDDKKAFQNELTKIKRLEEISGTNSFMTKKYGDAYESGKSVKAFGYNDIMQLNAYDEFVAVYDKNRMNTRDTTNTMKEAIARLDPNDPKYKSKVVQTYSSITTQEKHTRRAERDSTRLDTTLTKWLTEVGDEGNDAIPAIGMDVALKDYIVNTTGVDNSAQVLYDTKGVFINRTFDYGTTAPESILGIIPTGVKPDQRSLLPFGANSRQTSKAIDTLRVKYAGKIHKNVDKGDVILENVYDPASKNVMIIVKLRDKPTVRIGTVTYQNGAILSQKYDELEE